MQKSSWRAKPGLLIWAHPQKHETAVRGAERLRVPSRDWISGSTFTYEEGRWVRIRQKAGDLKSGCFCVTVAEWERSMGCGRCDPRWGRWRSKGSPGGGQCEVPEEVKSTALQSVRKHLWGKVTEAPQTHRLLSLTQFHREHKAGRKVECNLRESQWKAEGNSGGVFISSSLESFDSGRERKLR